MSPLIEPLPKFDDVAYVTRVPRFRLLVDLDTESVRLLPSHSWIISHVRSPCKPGKTTCTKIFPASGMTT